MSSLFSRITTMRKTTRSNLVTFGIVIAFYLVVQLLSGAGVLSNSFRGQLIPICAYVVMAVSLNLTVGFLGELSLGHAGFMSVGAFAGVLVWTVLGESLPAFVCLPLAFLAGGVVAGLFGVVVGVPVLRLSGDYLALVTLIRSRTGRAITAIRDNEVAGQSVGINLPRYKLTAFVVSAVFAGLAGVLYGLNFSSLTASRFDYNTSIQILVFVVLGGMGSVRGSIIAAALLTVLPEMLRGLNDYRMLIYAVVLIAMMIFNQSPQMVAWRKRFVEKFRARFAKSKEVA